MALKDTWIDKRDNVDDVLADDINDIAHAVIEEEERSRDFSNQFGNVYNELSETLRHTPMSLTDEQKAVSRDNIGAGTVIEATALGDSVTLTDSADAALRGLNLFGKSTQQTTTGAQLASFPDRTAVTVNGITWVSSGGVITVSGTRTGAANSKDSAVGIRADIPVAAGTYSVSGSVTGVDVRAEITEADGTVTIWDESMGAFTLDGTETMCAIYCNVYAAVAVNAVLYPMLNVGTSAKAWEPYTGGAPAPSPDYPMEISSVGDGGAVEVAVNDQTIVVSTPNGLPGIPVASGGNYTDDSGQMWVCNEIDFARGVYVQRVAKKTFCGDSGERWSVIGNHTPPVITETLKSGDIKRSDSLTVPANAMNSKYKVTRPDWIYNDNGIDGISVPASQSRIYMRPSGNTATTAEGIKQWIAENPFDFLYILAAPIETPLTEEQLALFRGLRTAKPTTAITNDGGAGMAVTYAADTKAYVDGENQRQSLALMDMIESATPDAGGAVSKDWRLINTIRTTEETVNILIETDSAGNPFECDEVLIITSNLIVTAAGKDYFQLNNNNAYQTVKYGFFATATNNSGRHLRARVLDNLGAFELLMGNEMATIVNPTTGWVGIVSKKYVINAVQLKSTFQAGGTLYLYGR